MKPLALDLFCKAGGVTRGLQFAGFEVVGVDIKPQPRYVGDHFVCADALAPPFDLKRFAFIWASPPCDRWTPHAQQHGTDVDHPDLIGPTREMLEAARRPYCIENVPRAPLRTTLKLTGAMFGLNTYRKRHFETSFVILAPDPGAAFGPKSRPGSVTITGHSGGSSKRDGWSNGDKAAWQAAIGIDWMTNEEMSEAIPPVYSQFIGAAAMKVID